MNKQKILKLIVIIGIIIAGFYLFKPQIILIRFINPGQTSMMRYRIKEAKKRQIKYEVRQKWMDYNKISPALVHAIVIAEDEKFWEHHGFDWEGMLDAIKYDLKRKRILRGGSTITQQLAKNLYLKPKRSFLRKFHEALLAGELELFLSKRRIIELYLNVIEWGNGIFGAEMAARHYFDKSCSAISVEEALRLVAVLPNPRRYSPVRSSKFLDQRLDVLYKKYYRNNNSKITK